MKHPVSNGFFGIEFFRSQCYVPYFFQPNVRHLTILSQETHKHPCVNNFGDYIALTHSLLSAAATAEREGNFSKDLLVDGILAPQKMGTGLKRDHSVAGHWSTSPLNASLREKR